MLGFLTLILACQLFGEFIVGIFAVPVPGPVLGMLFLFLFLVFKGEVPDDLQEISDDLLWSMSLLFVPAGVGVMLHFQLLEQAALPIGVALAVSTVLTIIVTGTVMRWLGREKKRSKKEKAEKEEGAADD